MYSTNETLRAIGRVMARYAQEQAGTMNADGVIEAAPLLKPWRTGTIDEPAKYALDDVRTDEGQPWRCVQGHSHYGEPGWNPAQNRALWAPYHATKREYALAWVKPTNATDIYKTGEWMIWTDGEAYKCVQNTEWDPVTLPNAWEKWTGDGE